MGKQSRLNGVGWDDVIKPLRYGSVATAAERARAGETLPGSSYCGLFGLVRSAEKYRALIVRARSTLAREDVAHPDTRRRRAGQIVAL
jgi:hypothetical protein